MHSSRLAQTWNIAPQKSFTFGAVPPPAFGFIRPILLYLGIAMAIFTVILLCDGSPVSGVAPMSVQSASLQ